MNPHQEIALRKLAQSYKVVSSNPRDFIPEVLYHYTSARGFLGVVSESKLRASNFSYLNDSTELRYGTELVQQSVSIRLEDEANRLARRVLESVRQTIKQVGKGLDFYIACFCADADRLSQWRGYGSATGRYCLGFDADALWTVSPSCRLARAVYKEDEQADQIRQTLDKAVQALVSASTSTSEEDHDFAVRVGSLLADELVSRLCFFKHPGFKEEHEWRLVHRLEGLGDVKFDCANGFVRPFVEISFPSVRTQAGRALPLREVIVGSGRFAVESRKSAELLLATGGYAEVVVSESSVPYRDFA